MKDRKPADPAEFDQLRRLLLGPEQQRLEQLGSRLDNPEAFAAEVGEVLPRAMIKSAQIQGEELSRAMIPTVEEIVRLSVQKDIDRFADALFPVIGPAIRKSIKETMRQMLQSLNRTLEHSLSVRGLRWRLQSYRTGIPFAEIAMLHALVFRVEQVFLIHRDSSLLLSELGRDDIERQDPDLVSSMLSAINDFVADSFAREPTGTLDRVEVGELAIWIEAGPHAILALAIRGEAPNSLRTTMQVTLERVQAQAGDALAAFNGDTEPFDSVEPLLQDCLQAQFAEPASPWTVKTVLALLLAIGLLSAWAGHSWWQWSLRADTIAVFRQEPGYVITATGHEDGRLVLDGLRDPLARAPAALLAQAPLEPSRVVTRLAPYQSLSADFVALRAGRILQPPPSVELGVDRDRLIVSGVADRDWQQTLLTRLPLIAGIESLDDSGLRIRFSVRALDPPPTARLEFEAGLLTVSGAAPQSWIATLAEVPARYPDVDAVDSRALVNLTEVELLGHVEALEREVIYFDVSQVYDFDSIDTPRIAGLVKKIIAGAEELSLDVLISVKGYSDSVGSFEDNRLLSIERADFVAQALFNTGISPRHVAIRGLAAPVEAEISEAERRRNRRVNFEVALQPADGEL